MMGKFEKGQYVRVLDASGAPRSYVKGEVGTVEEFYGLDMVRLAGKSAGMLERRFEPWVPKVGERVQFLRDSSAGGARFGAEGQLATVTRFPNFVDHFDKAWAEVELDNTEICFKPSAYLEDLAPVITPATLTIEAGKFYKTRDGRKVGPLTEEGENEHYPFRLVGGPYGKVYVREDGTANLGMNESSSKDWDIIAEWVDEPKAGNDNGATLGHMLQAAIGKTVTVNIAQQKFKVGDIVKRANNFQPHQRLRITKVDGDRYSVEWISGGPGSIDSWRGYEFELVRPTPTTPAIVCLIENGQPKPSTTPHVHADEVKAGKEAARLAGVYKGKEFGVFVLTTTAQQAAPVYKHEWQRQAAAGNKISAIKELRAANDLTLKGAKDAVEHWLDTAA